jgi:serine/threonine protein kinase
MRKATPLFNPFLTFSRGEVKVKIAMKELLIGFELLDESIIEEFLREIKLMSALTHPNIVLFLGIALPDENTICLITELMECGSIKQFVAAEQDISWELRIELLIGAARGL